MYSPASLCDDHLGAQVVELVPQVFGLESAVDAEQLGAVAARRDDGGGRRRARGTFAPPRGHRGWWTASFAAAVRLHGRRLGLRAGRTGRGAEHAAATLAVRTFLDVHLFFVVFIVAAATNNCSRIKIAFNLVFQLFLHNLKMCVYQKDFFEKII